MQRISLGYNAVAAEAKTLIQDIFDRGQFSPGKNVREFEEKWALLHKAKHAIFVNSGTDALRLSLLAMKEKYAWQDGDRVAVPALTFVATVNVILQANLKPFFVDVGMNDYLINADNFEHFNKTGKIPNLRAVMPVHLFGQPCGKRIYELAQTYKLRVLEDSCETILNPIKGDASCYSTYMAHHVTTGVGGMAVTNDEELNLLIRSFANHGRNIDYLPGYRNKGDIKKRFLFDRVGYSSRGTEFEAALGLSQLKGLEDTILRRQLIASLLSMALHEWWDDLLVPTTNKNHTFMMYPIVIKQASRIKKYELCEHLEKNGIETRDMMPIVDQPCYKEYFDKEYEFSVARWINRCGFYIPCHPGMDKQDVSHIQQVFSGLLDKKGKRA